MDLSLSSIPIEPPPPIPPPPIIPAFPVVTAANPTEVANGGGGGLPFNHPPYSDMIVEAIAALKDRNGSSKRAIAKYIESTHKDLPPTHSALLTHHMKRLKNNGLLVMVKKSYKLAFAARSEASIQDLAQHTSPDASAVGPKRGRGRPPKPKPNPQPTLSHTVVDPSTQQPPLPPVALADRPKKSAGRPKKNGPDAVQIGVRRGRGRPPKTGPKKSSGRPRKPKTVRSVVAANAVKRGRGRPPKVATLLPPQALMPIQGQPMAVPYADAAVPPTTAAVVAPNSPKPRGRPKAVAGGAAAGGVTGKRRGRPPKIGRGVVAAKPLSPRKATGKPVGRPRKATGGAESNGLAAAYGDLKRKLEYFQAKVKQAIGVLKPQFTGESNISAIGAIQELEGLAAMDIDSTFKDGAQQQLPLMAASNQPPLLAPPPMEGQVH